eukprot:166476_1
MVYYISDVDDTKKESIPELFYSTAGMNRNNALAPIINDQIVQANNKALQNVNNDVNISKISTTTIFDDKDNSIQSERSKILTENVPGGNLLPFKKVSNINNNDKNKNNINNKKMTAAQRR